MVHKTEPVRIDLSQFKLHIRIGPVAGLTLHFDSPSRRFYLGVIALVVYQMKQLGRIASIPMEAHRETLMLLNDTVGGSAGSAANLIPRIYRKWKDVLPDLESGRLFKIAGKKKVYEDGGGALYRFSDAEKDAWANLFEYKGSEHQVRLRFSLDRLGAGLSDVVLVYQDLNDAPAWEQFIADLGQPEQNVAPQPKKPFVLAEAPANPLYRQVFIGRRSELDQLTTAFDAALTGAGGLVMIAGEPGIGKSSLCEQLMIHAEAKGGKILIGHCYEQGALSLPYLAFIDALSSYVRDCPVDILRSQLGPAAPAVARIVPEIRDTLAMEPLPGRSPEEERYRLFQGVADFLGRIAQSQPVLLVLEDLHGADPGTLEMLGRACRSLAGQRLLIVGTYRDVEVDRRHPLTGALADLKRLPSTTRLLLKGLASDDVKMMFSAIANQEIGPSLVEAVHRQTEGNPLFVQEVIHYFMEKGITHAKNVELQIPDGLKDVIGKRLSALSEECNKLLCQAAVIGREFSIDILEQVTDLAEEKVYSALEGATRAGIIEEHTAIGGNVRYRFIHAFFRQTLYDEIIAPRRNRLHGQVARAIEKIHKLRLDDHAVALADHYAHSSHPSDLRKAMDYSERAAARAAAVYAFAEATWLLEQALTIHDIVDPLGKEKRCNLLLGLAETLLYTGKARRALDIALPEAFAIAEIAGDNRQCSRACQLAILGLLFRSNVTMQGWGTPEAEQWVERAERYAAPDDVTQAWADIGKGCLYCTRGVFTGQSAAMKIGVDACHHALQQARSFDDSRLFYWAVNIWLTFARAPQHFEERLSLAHETVDMPFFGLDILGFGPSVIADVFLMSGMREQAEKYYRQVQLTASQTGHVFIGRTEMLLQSILATLDGRLEEAVQISDRIKQDAQELEMAMAVVASLCAVTPRLLLGRTEEAYAAAVAHQAPLLAHIRKDREARDLLDRWVVGRPGIGTADDENGVTLDTALLEAAVIVGHEQAAGMLLQRLSCAAGYAVTINRQTCIGRHLGAAAAMLGRPAQARDYYGQAMELAQKLRFRPEIALIRLQLAELLLDHYPEEKTAALEHLDVAIAECREMKMQPALKHGMQLKERSDL